MVQNGTSPETALLTEKEKKAMTTMATKKHDFFKKTKFILLCKVVKF